MSKWRQVGGGRWMEYDGMGGWGKRKGASCKLQAVRWLMAGGRALTMCQYVDGLVVPVEEAEQAALEGLQGPISSQHIGIELKVLRHVLPLEQLAHTWWRTSRGCGGRVDCRRMLICGWSCCSRYRTSSHSRSRCSCGYGCGCGKQGRRWRCGSVGGRL